jgi:hypothetical protein
VAVAIRFGKDEIARRNIDGAEAARETACPGTRRIDMAAAGSVPEFGDRIGPLFLMRPEPQENVIVAIEYELHVLSWAGCRSIEAASIKKLTEFAIPL